MGNNLNGFTHRILLFRHLIVAEGKMRRKPCSLSMDYLIRVAVSSFVLHRESFPRSSCAPSLAFSSFILQVLTKCGSHRLAFSQVMLRLRARFPGTCIEGGRASQSSLCACATCLIACHRGNSNSQVFVQGAELNMGF